jgi:hypothetical protein
MKMNLGSLDRVLRVVIALTLGIMLAAHVMSGTLAVVLGIVAVALLVTSGLSFCPLYALLGWTTAKKS